MEDTKAVDDGYDAHETLKPKEPPFTVQGGDPIGPWTVQFWADAARATARSILDGTKLLRPVIEFPETERDPEFEPSEAARVATSAEQVSWSMLDYQRGDQAAVAAPVAETEAEVVLESRSALIRQVGRLNNAAGIAKEVEEALVQLGMLPEEQTVILRAIALLNDASETIDPRKPGERT